MFGAIIGDIVGSKYEFNNIKTKDFDLFSYDSMYTDDTIMTVAVARALLLSREQSIDFKDALISQMQELGRAYPHPKGGYGGRFSQWIFADEPQPYNSFGNGSAMRVSPCGLIAIELYEALSLAKASAEVTHNHPEGIKGAQAVAGAVFLAKQKREKAYIKDFICANFYDLDFTINEIRDTYKYNETCQDTVPQAIVAFLESDSFEDAIRNAVSLGGDCDTLTAITGSIAWAYYAPDTECLNIADTAKELLPKEFLETIELFDNVSMHRKGTYFRTGMCPSTIPHKKPMSYEENFILSPAPISIDSDIPLREKVEGVFKASILSDFCSAKRFVDVLFEHKIGVLNYDAYMKLCDDISKDVSMLNSATLEVCLIYLTYLWRMDYWSGGYADFDYRHRDEIRAARMRIVDLLFYEI